MAVPFSREPVFRSWARGTTSCKAFSDWWKASVCNRPVGFRLFFWPKTAAAFLPLFRLSATFCFWFDGIGECLLLFWCWSLFGFFWLALLFVFTEVLWFMLAAPGFDFDFFFSILSLILRVVWVQLVGPVVVGSFRILLFRTSDDHGLPYHPRYWPPCEGQCWPHEDAHHHHCTWKTGNPNTALLAVSCFLMRHGVLRHDFKWVACLKPKKNTAGTKFWRYRKHDGNSHGACKKAPDASFKWFKSQDQI